MSHLLDSGSGTNFNCQTPSPPPENAPQCALTIDCETWQRDSHDLFDYEARSVHKCRIVASRGFRVVRNGTSVRAYAEGDPGQHTDGSADLLMHVRIRDGRYVVIPADRSHPNNSILPKKLFLIVKELPEEHHVLQEGDIIKLGRFKLKVKQLASQIQGEPVPELKLDDTDVGLSEVSHEYIDSPNTPLDGQPMQCRICLLEGGSPKDPLVCPCQCKGSIKYVHVDCLRHWINGKLNFSDERRFFYKITPCELCKQQYPSTINLPTGEKIQIVKVPNIQAPFIVLENLIGVSRGIHFSSLAGKDELKLGRGHESDVRIPDVSISRYHATIRFNETEREFTLDDHKSKFGTLISLRRPHYLSAGEKFSVQVGRTVLRFLADETVPCVDEIQHVDVTNNHQPDSGGGDSGGDGGGGGGDVGGTSAPNGLVEGSAMGGSVGGDGLNGSSCAGNPVVVCNELEREMGVVEGVTPNECQLLQALVAVVNQRGPDGFEHPVTADGAWWRPVYEAHRDRMMLMRRQIGDRDSAELLDEASNGGGASSVSCASVDEAGAVVISPKGADGFGESAHLKMRATQGGGCPERWD
eukprot:CAMPEP_0113844246 /NCGR_PEP_ID=MMETSP0372-20130328/141_1 /TAXON_ID=340204 /ORGANISM="Lankesteria abbotti" /LENGTH=582 /DNA_ID=CAMNT_0000813249 /DNA_START=152 /DNA_END=1900 /DNA_ORIENTATION=+ /assembly_acc=CAM_ASM_000359